MANDLLLISLAASLGALLLIIGAYLWIVRREREDARMLRARLEGFGSSFDGMSDTSILKRVESDADLIDRFIANRGSMAVIADEMRRAGMKWTVRQFTTYVVGGFAVGVVAAFWLPFIVALPAGIVCAASPFFIVMRRRKQRDRRVEEQLPEAVDMLVNSMRAGFSLQAGMNVIGAELPAPAGPEFARFYDEQRLGIDVKHALINLQARLGTLDSRMMVLAILIQRETGGNLAEILGNLSKVIRERIKFRDTVGILTAESKVSAYILSALPLLLFAVIQMSNPDYVGELTGTPTGRILLGYAGASLAIGVVLMQKMAKVEQ